MTIGRDPDNDVVLPELTVSRQHAVLYRSADRFLVQDLDSSNGTYVDGAPVRMPTRLGDRAEIGIGGAVLCLAAGTHRLSRPHEALLQLRGASYVTPDGTQLLDGVDLEVRRGELVAVVGPSGAGKSTLMSLLNGSRLATRGEVRLLGLELNRHRGELRQQIGYVPQEDVIHLQLSPRSLLRYAAELRLAADVPAVERDRRVDGVLASLGLAHVADRRVTNLSGGQRKRVNVALELLTDPAVLLLDEPTSGLDPAHDLDLMRLLRQLADRGRAVVVVTHSVAQLRLCDAVVFLAAGGRAAYVGPAVDAPAALAAADLIEVFRLLERGATAPRPGRPLMELPAEPSAPPPPLRRADPWSQLGVLLRRYRDLLLADRRNLALLTLQAPLIGLLIRAINGVDGLGPAPTGAPNSHARRVLFALVLAITWIGASNSVREVVKERRILLREQAAGVAVAPYLGSKLLVLWGITAAQAAVLLLLATVGRRSPGAGVLLPGLVELWLGLTLAGGAAMCIGLLISAVANNADRALSLLPLLLVPQLLLSGGLLSLNEAPALRWPSYLASSRWGFAALAGTVDLNRLEGPRAAADWLWRHDPASWGLDCGFLLLISILAVLVAGRSLLKTNV